MSNSTVTDSIRSNLIARLPFLLVVLIGLGNALFGITAILPPLRAHEDLQAQVSDGQQMLADRKAQKGQQTEADVLQAQIDGAEANLEKAASLFWTELQLNGIMGRLYEYADASGVRIVNLQSQQPSGQSAQPKKNDGYDVRTFRLQVEGPVPQLLNFVARIRELSLPTVNAGSLNIARSDKQNTLTMNLLVFTSPYATGEVFSTLPKLSTPTRIPPSAAPVTLSPTPTVLPPTSTPLPMSTLPPATPTLKPSPTAGTPTLAAAQECSDQATETLRRLVFSEVQAATTACQSQVWNITLDRAYDIVIDIERRSGNGQYRLELHDNHNTVVTTAPSSIDGRGILVAKAGPGAFTVNVVPLAATGNWAYSIALWKGMPSLSFSFTQSSYSSHTSAGDKANVTRWRYVLTSSQSYHVEVVRTDGNLEYSVAVLDAAGKPLTSSRSSDGNATIALTSNAGAYFVEVTARGGTSGSYRISLVP